jgi:hypothetical protein
MDPKRKTQNPPKTIRSRNFGLPTLSTSRDPGGQTEGNRCLGTTAAQAVLGRPTKILENRGKALSSDICQRVFVTLHPSALLRIQEPDQRAQAMEQFVADLANVLG